MNSHSYIMIFLLVVFSTYVSAAETACESCRALSRGILDGLDKTKKKNFEGGDVAWEEKNLGKYKTSETRLVEILESYACSKDNHKCNSILEEKEDSIYRWYNKLQDETPLFDYLCVEEAKLCCPDGKFGPECEECPKSEGSDKICFGRGTCEGDGDREGSGKCVCDEGYAGDLCNECAERHFETFSNDTYLMCSLCHQSCKTCKGNKSNECISCVDGYREEENIDDEDELKCTDINECVEQANLCPVGTYCLNNEGSYSCEACSSTCTSCFGPSFRHCYTCEPGTLMKIPYMCQGTPQTKDTKADSEGENVEKDQVEDGLSDDDIKRMVMAVVICIIGTAAARGDLIWTALFFFSIVCAGIWWASDKTEHIVNHMANQHREL